MAAAKPNGTAEARNRREIVRTITTAKRVRNSARDLVRALYVLESSLDFDFYGRIVWVPDESADSIASEVADLLRLARADYPEQEIEVSVQVQVPASGSERQEQGGQR